MTRDKKNRPLERDKSSDVRRPQSKLKLFLGSLWSWFIAIGGYSKSKGSLFWGYLMGIKLKSFVHVLSALIAIGAYSKGSIFFRYVMPTKDLSVVRTWSIGGPPMSDIFISNSTGIGEIFVPVQVMVYLNIRNESEEPQTIEGFSVEFQGQDGHWTPATVLSAHGGDGVYTDIGGRTKYKKAKLMDLQRNSLEFNLGSGSLAPHQVVSGWAFLEFPDRDRERVTIYTPLRITICSGFGEREMHEIKNVDLSPNAMQTTKSVIKYISGVERDLSELPIMTRSDLMKKLAEERAKIEKTESLGKN